VFMVTWVARSTRDLPNTLNTTTERKAGFRSLGDAWADTTTAYGRLVVTVLGGLVEFEKELIRARTGEGRARDVARGVKMGRKPKLTPHHPFSGRVVADESRGTGAGRPPVGTRQAFFRESP